MSNQYVTDGLRVKLAEIQTTIRTTEQRLRALAMDKDTITRALAIMGVEAGDGALSLGIPSGAFTRTIMEVLRDAPEPLTVRDIAAVLAKRSERPLDKRRPAPREVHRHGVETARHCHGEAAVGVRSGRRT